MQKKIKVLHIIKSLGRGGAEMLLPETLKLHNQDQFEFHYIYFLPWKNQLEETIRHAGGIIQCMNASNSITILLQAKRITNYIQKHNIQLVHAHLPWAGFVSRLVYKLTGIPVVYSEHNRQERYHGITFFLNKLTFNWQRQAIAVSQDVAESIKKNIAPTIPVTTILNGVNTQHFLRHEQAGKSIREQHNIPFEAIVIGTIAVFRFQKRLVEWLAVAKAILEKTPQVYFIIVGDGPLKNEILEKRKSLGCESNVIMAGLQEEVRPWLSAMDVYMMSSVFEGLPIALLEAMSMKCAVVTTDAGGIKEVITHDTDGLLVPVEEWGRLTEQAVRLLTDETLRLKLAAAARQRVEDQFSLKRMVHELETLYKNISQQIKA
jgi:L-malate glycosyltransferase